MTLKINLDGLYENTRFDLNDFYLAQKSEYGLLNILNRNNSGNVKTNWKRKHNINLSLQRRLVVLTHYTAILLCCNSYQIFWPITV